MIYLIVGLDRNTLEPWHANVHAGDIATAKRLALARAAARGITLVIAGVIGPGPSALADPTEQPATSPQAA